MRWADELRRLLRRPKKDPMTEEPGGLSCQEAAERLFEWLDGELEPELGARVGEHLETCARCYPWLVFERSFRAAVAGAARVDRAPEALRRRILSQLKQEGSDPGP
jgi:mycothiol system anti-sigma-R factor